MPMHHELLHPEALNLAELLGGAEALQGLVLVGGTALALQIGHRLSLDFDFACLEERLPVARLDGLVSRLKAAGHEARLITSPQQIASFRINAGEDLLALTRDYVIDGVKVTFFVLGRNPAQRDFFRNAETVRDERTGLTLMGLEGLRVAKTLVLAERVRSRDLYDLHVLMRDHGVMPDDLFRTVRELATVDDPEYYRSVLRGQIPLDAADEGLDAVDVTADMNEVHGFFNRILDEWETARAREFFGD